MSSEEVARIMDGHQKELTDALRRHDNSRNKQGGALRQKLTERRRKREQELHEKHKKEVGKFTVKFKSSCCWDYGFKGNCIL